jgi:hemerythrin-like metal-binding protein
MGQLLSTVDTGLDATTENGVREVGRGHACIFALVGEFIGMVRSGAETHRLAVVIEDIIAQTTDHFRTEEAMMRHLGHRTWATQSKIHQKILNEIASLRDRMATGESVPTGDCLHVFDSLIIHHVRDEMPSQTLGKTAPAWRWMDYGDTSIGDGKVRQ